MATKLTLKKERPISGLRRPSRGRGKARYETLLQATEALLQSANPDEIGLYQIAEQAGVPPASVYHFFPTKEAAYEALAERDLHGLLRMHGEPIDARRIRTWQDLLAFDMRRAMDYANSRKAMLKIIYGGYGGVEARKIDILITDHIAFSSYDRLNRIFHVPVAADARKAQIQLAILDGIWAVSVRLHGRITEEYFEESVRACTAYRRLYLPEHLEPREYLADAAARGKSIRLPYLDDEETPEDSV